jgi:hypothetical protein
LNRCGDAFSSPVILKFETLTDRSGLAAVEYATIEVQPLLLKLCLARRVGNCPLISTALVETRCGEDDWTVSACRGRDAARS